MQIKNVLEMHERSCIALPLLLKHVLEVQERSWRGAGFYLTLAILPH